MTKPRKQDDPSPIDPELERILVQERADEAWAEYVMNEQPSALARYLILGGEVTDVVRAALIDALLDHPGGRRGGSRPYRDWQSILIGDGENAKEFRRTEKPGQFPRRDRQISRARQPRALAETVGSGITTRQAKSARRHIPCRSQCAGHWNECY